ncbi:MAG: hypothetical protein A3F84_12785 [Candidatus Handelsmanbacteria bacterium RIFCSPLOWO2_12_FULL_64_10]|uniref:Polymerase nucleotidyl transferase domain-containing protein n=1 Tax=Handelsmanbacteria sp. (strain RIFCSPLOWO2_12_FULL_64_10) TaxID=1817868 RepID=A0A1F6CF36_HANXR|nr:MAG: hypothetical protein A3F84_12785 [Candidatus Handelsmanbacteria bacterium RIFCSPLOWO2_12_FULL_64_10]
MPLAGPLIPISDLRFHRASPSPDSLRLLRVACDYLGRLPPRPVVAVCVCSSVAWGNATPASDLDVGLIVPEDTPLCSEKRPFGEDFVDHCEWPFSWITDLVEDPLQNPILSYTVAFALVLFDPEGRLAAVQRRLAPAILNGGAKRWIDHFLGRAGQMRSKVRQKLNADPQADVASLLFEAVRRLSDAVLHLAPGGHCGEWPSRLRELAAQTDRPWLAEEALTILAPRGLDLAGLASAIDPIERLHHRSATPPCGASIGCSAVSATFFARKARYYAQAQDGLSLIRVLGRVLDYVDENLDAKQVAGGGAPALAALQAEGQRIQGLIRRAWPLDQASIQASVERLDLYVARIANVLQG